MSSGQTSSLECAAADPFSRPGYAARACIRHSQEFHLCPRSSNGCYYPQSGQDTALLGMADRHEGKTVKHGNSDVRILSVNDSYLRMGMCNPPAIFMIFQR